jgi:hypothetical protein
MLLNQTLAVLDVASQLQAQQENAQSCEISFRLDQAIQKTAACGGGIAWGQQVYDFRDESGAKRNECQYTQRLLLRVERLSACGARNDATSEAPAGR